MIFQTTLWCFSFRLYSLLSDYFLEFSPSISYFKFLLEFFTLLSVIHVNISFCLSYYFLPFARLGYFFSSSFVFAYLIFSHYCYPFSTLNFFFFCFSSHFSSFLSFFSVFHLVCYSLFKFSVLLIAVLSSLILVLGMSINYIWQQRL